MTDARNHTYFFRIYGTPTMIRAENYVKALQRAKEEAALGTMYTAHQIPPPRLTASTDPSPRVQQMLENSNGK